MNLIREVPARVAVALLSLCLLATTLGLPLKAEAATNFNLTTSPLPVDLTTTPGATITTPIRVENTGTAPVTLSVKLDKFAAYGNQGKPAILTPTASDTFIKWASFSQTSFVAQPNVFNTVTMTLKIPKDAAFGYYYAVVFSEVNNNPATGPRQTTVNGAVATLVLLNVNAPGEKRQLTVTNFSVAKKFYEYLPATFNITVKNTGNIHVIPTGNIFITKNQKTNLATLDINSGQGNILPNSSRIFQVQWSDGFPVYQPKVINGQVVSDKNSKPEQQLTWNFNHLSKLRFGKYTANMELVYNNGTEDVPIQGSVSFWVIPWGLILMVILIPTVPALLVYFFMRWRIRRKYGLKTKKTKAEKA